MKLYIGIDLHSTNCYFGVVNERGERLYSRRINNNPELLLKTMKRIAKLGDICQSTVESTYNWYWLVDLLQDNGYEVILANPAQVRQFDGVKCADDKNDAYFLAELLRLKCLPACWICPREQRPVRDLLRARMFFVKQRTALKISLTLLCSRYCGQSFSAAKLASMSNEQRLEIIGNSNSLLRINQQLCQIHNLNESIQTIENQALSQLSLSPEFERLQSIPGIGKILAMVIMVETGDINRFAKSGNYTSYCRCVDSRRTSNGKSKGSNNRKNGNKYLSWAFAEAAVGCKRWCEGAEKFYLRKKNQSGSTLALKSLAAKLSKATYQMLNKQEDFDENKTFA